MVCFQSLPIVKCQIFKTMNIKIRINDIGAIPVTYLEDFIKENPKSGGKTPSSKVNSKPDAYELALVKYHKNRYYGLLDQYLADGWEDKGDFVHSQGVSISKTSFQSPETSYVLAFVKLHKNETETELQSVGDRLLYIEPNEKDDFFEVYRLADQKLQLIMEKDSKIEAFTNIPEML